MKLKVLTIVFFISVVGYSQQIIPIENGIMYDASASKDKYFKDVNGVFQKFLGTWRYQNHPTHPTEIFEITFYIQANRSFGHYTKDMLNTKFRYIKNGVVIMDTYNDPELYIFGGRFLTSNLNKIRMSHFEPGLPLRIRKDFLSLEYVSEGMQFNLNTGQWTGEQKLIWRLDYWTLTEETPAPLVPLYMELRKQ